MSGFNTEPVLKGMQGTRPITPAHIFTSESPLMESWGLCSFTKDNLDFISNYGNFQKIFNKGTEGDVQTNVTYNSIIDDNKEEYINITVWRNKGRNGEYIKYEKLSDWQFEDTEGFIGAKGGIYKEKDLKLDDFITEDEEDESTPAIRSKIFAHILIALNTHVNTLDETEELETKDKVRIEFLTDIMSSKERCISWNQTIIYYDGVVVSADQPPNQDGSTSSGEDEFSEGDSEDGNADELEDGVGPDQATSVRVEYTKEQTHECEIKLYLYSIKDGEIKDDRSVCLKNLNFTNPRSTYDFGEFLKKEDGKLSDLLDSDNPNNDVAAPLDLQYVEYLGRWESGSAQMIAMISEGIPPAETIDIEYIEKNPTEKLLDHETGQQIVYGSAIPIHMQNGNPKQWCATYDKVEGVRGTDDFQKSAIRVHNLSDKGFARGELVVLNRIEGLWFPITSVSSSGVGGVGGLQKLEPADPQWEFMYLMTSADFHFQTEEHEKLTPFDYEKGFYRKYYKAFSDANSAIETQNQNANLNRHAESFAKFAKVRNEYFQISSFDFVNQNLGGVRSTTLFEQSTDSKDVQIDRGHAISNTIYGEDLDGTTYGNGEKLKTYPFFGCVFPEGHSAGAFIDKILNADTNPADYADVKNYGKPYPGIDTYSLMTEVYYGTKEELKEKNDLKDPLTGNAQPLGLLSNLADSNFKHVPADIATNAGPNGRWGRPIEWVGYFDLLDDDIYKNPKEHTSCDIFLSKIQTDDGKSTVPLRGSFLYVKGQAEDTPASGYDNYWYDIQPLNHYSIQFRPLSRELYASFEGYDEGQQKYDFLAKGLDAFGLGGRGDVSNRIYQAVEGFIGPLSKTSWHRNLTHLVSKNVNEPKSLIGNYGLKYSSDLVYNTPFGSDNRLFNLPANVDGTDDGYPFKHWDSDWMKKDGVTMRPGGAIGIIGAVKTVRSRDTIAFSTDNTIGLGDHLVVTTPLEYGSTMKNGDIDDQLTTALYARVYQHHPRHLTWYDPRFMVVHHFSAGDGRTSSARKHVKFKLEQEDSPDALFEDGIDRFKTQENGMFVYYATHENGVVFEDELEDFDFSASNKNYDPAASGYFLIDKVEYNVDFRVPTDWTKNNIPVGNKRVFSDSTTNLTSKLITIPATTVEQMREVDHWNVNNNRRSKLLPYSYRFKTIGISKSKAVQFSPNDEKVDLSANNTAVVNKGSGYKVGDKFEVIGGVGFGTVFTVQEIDADGAITDISIAGDDETGMRYEPQDFVAVLKEEDGAFVENEILWDDENTPSSSLSLQPISDTDVTGTGFEAYVFYGEVVLTTELTDIKPLEALDSTGPIKLTPNIPRNDTNRNQDQIITPVGNSYQILNTHFDHKYDIFLRYHNDISHVTMNDTNPPNASEQQVTLTVGVNLGQAPTSSPSDQLGMSFDASDNAAGSLLGGLGGDPFSNFDEDSAADGAGSFLGFGGGVGGNSSFR